MDDNIAVIHEYPVGGVIAFNLFRTIAGTAQLFFHAVRKGLDLAAVAAAGNQKIICQNGYFADVNNADVFRFLIFQGCKDVYKRQV